MIFLDLPGTEAPDLTKLAPPRGDFPWSRQAAIQLHVQRQHLAMAVMGKKNHGGCMLGK
jgi:hypothetical protein